MADSEDDNMDDHTIAGSVDVVSAGYSVLVCDENESSVGAKGRESLDFNSSFDESQCCSICYDPFTSDGPHRLCCLKCGHLFGHSCVRKWVKSNRNCPTCKSKANLPQLRILYCDKAVKIVNTNELQKVNDMLAAEKRVRMMAQSECAELRSLLTSTEEKCRIAEERLRAMMHNRDSYQVGSQLVSQSKSCLAWESVFQLLKSIELCKQASEHCRVLAHCSATKHMACSQPVSSHSVFSLTAGVRKIAMDESFNTVQIMPLHKAPIRDMQFNPQDAGLLLSCSVDKTVKLSSAHSNAILESFNVPCPAWSCCWRSPDSNQFFVGLLNGKIYLYDCRMGREDVAASPNDLHSPVLEIPSELSKTGVHRLFWNKISWPDGSSSEGLFACHLNRVIFYEFSDALSYIPHVLAIEGSTASLSYHSDSRSMLMSYRPNETHPFVRHEVRQLIKQEYNGSPIVSSNLLWSFEGGRTMKQLRRSTLQTAGLGGEFLVAGTFNEDDNSVLLWNTKSQQKAGQVKLADSSGALDMCLFPVNGPLGGRAMGVMGSRSVSFFRI